MNRDLMTGEAGRALARAGAAVFLVAILLATLTPASEAARVGGDFFCLVCGAAPVANAVRNVLLFLPFGFFAFGLLPRVLGVALLGAAVSGSVEALQIVIPGRNPLVVDFMANTAGAGLGAMMAAAAPTWIRPAGAAGRRTFLVAAGLAALAAVASSLLLVPAPPRGDLWVQWNPPIGSAGAYPGPVLRLRLGAITMEPGPVPAGEDVAGAFLAGDPLAVTFRRARPGHPGDALLRILSSADGRPVISLAVMNDAVAAGLSYRAGLFGLAHPRAWARGILAGAAPGDAATLTVRLRPDGGLRMDGPGGRTDGPAVDPSMGWSLLYFPHGAGPRTLAALGFLWCGGLVFIPAFLGRRRGEGAWAALLVLLLLAAPPLSTPFLAPLPLAGWAGALVGWTAGRAARAGVDRRLPGPDKTLAPVPART
jgi:hypothetical protein